MMDLDDIKTDGYNDEVGLLVRHSAKIVSMSVILPPAMGILIYYFPFIIPIGITCLFVITYWSFIFTILLRAKNVELSNRVNRLERATGLVVREDRG